MTGPRILIVGGVAGGASAAARARRLSEEASIVLFERGPMSPSPTAACLTTSAVSSGTGPRCWSRPRKASYARFDIDVRVNTEVMAIDPAAQIVVARDLRSGRETQEPYDALVLSPGAAPIRPAIPGADDPRDLHLAQHGRHGRHPGGGAQAGLGGPWWWGPGSSGWSWRNNCAAAGCRVALVEKLDHVLGAADGEMTVQCRKNWPPRGWTCAWGARWPPSSRMGRR